MSSRQIGEEQETSETRKDYAAPQILWTEKLTARASVCMAADTATCAPGPIQT